MHLDYASRLKLAIILLLLSSVLPAMQVVRRSVAGAQSARNHDVMSKREERYRKLRELLPPYGTVGYTTDFPVSVLDIDDVVSYDEVKTDYRTLQYALAPVVLKPVSPETADGVHFVLRRSHTVPKQLVFHSQTFVLVKDFGDGISVYVRTPD